MTRNDAQLLFDWLCRRYGYPGELERPATTTFIERSAYYKREPKHKNTDNVRAVGRHPQKDCE